MTPSVDERLASIIRALNDVIAPALPDDAGLAKEQLQLAVGHMQILRVQLDLAADFESEELADAISLASSLESVTGSTATDQSITKLKETLSAAGRASGPQELRASRVDLHEKIDALVKAVFADGYAESCDVVRQTILEHESARVLKDRKWLAPFGFDTFEMN